jgi:hypothetical protein
VVGRSCWQRHLHRRGAGQDDLPRKGSRDGYCLAGRVSTVTHDRLRNSCMESLSGGTSSVPLQNGWRLPFTLGDATVAVLSTAMRCKTPSASTSRLRCLRLSRQPRASIHRPFGRTSISRHRHRHRHHHSLRLRLRLRSPRRHYHRHSRPRRSHRQHRGLKRHHETHAQDGPHERCGARAHLW